jgi:type IV pilus assembly protein PilV
MSYDKSGNAAQSGSLLANRSSRHSGFSIVEVLVAILVFSTGIVGLMAAQASAVRGSTDAKYRADAAFLASQILGRMWANRGDLQANPANFAHRPAGAACAPSGASAVDPDVVAWLAEVDATLPQASAATQQIVVGANQAVTITICWQAPGDTAPHKHVVTAQLVGSSI